MMSLYLSLDPSLDPSLDWIVAGPDSGFDFEKLMNQPVVPACRLGLPMLSVYGRYPRLLPCLFLLAMAFPPAAMVLWSPFSPAL